MEQKKTPDPSNVATADRIEIGDFTTNSSLEYQFALMNVATDVRETLVKIITRCAANGYPVA